MPELKVTRSLSIPIDEIDIRFARSGGPGGQNVNRRETKVEVRLNVLESPSLGPRQRARIVQRLGHRIDGQGVLRVVSSESRSQLQNRESALERLASLLADALKQETPRKPTRPSKAADRRRLEEKKKRSAIKRERSWRSDE